MNNPDVNTPYKNPKKPHKELYPLTAALFSEDRDIFNILVMFGANTNIISSKNNQTLLMVAAFYNKINCIKIILRNDNIDVNHQSKQGYTAIMFTRNPAIINLLVAKGANRGDAGKALQDIKYIPYLRSKNKH